ncbi:MAG TPA: ribonuclease III [Lachnospiraceae bacterium]|nr:ribonuclease III [Lachnospiraceae bacterium]
MNQELKNIEDKINYSFKDKGLLKLAVTHTSYANEHKKERIRHNERLEFLGDAVLETVCSEYLYRRYPEKEEGELSKLRASLVCESSLAICARDLGLPEYLRLGNGEELMGGRQKESIISDATESLIGAIYLDGGFEKAREFVLTFILADLKTKDLYVDNKTRLQEILQDKDKKVEYIVTEETGPAHDKNFEITAFIGGEAFSKGTGHTKKAAAQSAAREAIRKLTE